MNKNLFIFTFIFYAQASYSEPIEVISSPRVENWNEVRLGRKLFFEKRLSKTNAVACVSCHDLTKGGADSLPFSRGVYGQIGIVNTPTVFNAVYNFSQFWDGRARDLLQQADGPVHDPIEMGSNWLEIVSKLKRDQTYIQDFQKIYQSEIRKELIKKALVAFQSALVTPDSSFDQYLLGDKNAITENQKLGYQLFKQYGCISCHQGRNVGGNLFQKMGIAEDYFEDRGNIQTIDWGRYNVTGIPQDKFTFKVPSLRNIELTAPYFHDASAKTLEEAVYIMGRYQLGHRLEKKEIELIVEFLKSLTGKKPRSVYLVDNEGDKQWEN